MSDAIKLKVFSDVLAALLTETSLARLMHFWGRDNASMPISEVFWENENLGSALDTLSNEDARNLFKPILADALSDLLEAKVTIEW